MKEPDKIKAEPKKSSLQNAGTSRGNCRTSEFGKQVSRHPSGSLPHTFSLRALFRNSGNTKKAERTYFPSQENIFSQLGK
jgi:hypothetical protein